MKEKDTMMTFWISSLSRFACRNEVMYCLIRYYSLVAAE